MKNVLLYCRASTRKQSTISQENVLIEYCKKHNYNYKLFSEKISGRIKTSKRPKFTEMMEYIESNIGQCDTIIVFEISRISRLNSDFATKLDYFIDKEIDVFSYKENLSLFHYDANGKWCVNQTNKLTFNILSNIGEAELETTIKRVERTISQLKEQGKRVGGQFAPFGYDYDEDGFLTVNQEDGEDNIVRMIFDMYVNKGYGSRKIFEILDSNKIPTKIQNLEAKGVKVNRKRIETGWRASTINKILMNPIYYGADSNGKKIDAIIEKSTFEKAEKIRKSRTNVMHKHRYDYFIQPNLIKCGCCNVSYRGIRNTQKYKDKTTVYTYLRCHNKDVKSKQCQNHNIYITDFNSALWKALIDYERPLRGAFEESLNTADIDSKIKESEALIEMYQNELKRNKSDEKRFVKNIGELEFLDVKMVRNRHNEIKRKGEKILNDIAINEQIIKEQNNLKQSFSDYSVFIRNLKHNRSNIVNAIKSLIREITLYPVSIDDFSKRAVICRVEFLNTDKAISFIAASKNDHIILIDNEWDSRYNIEGKTLNIDGMHPFGKKKIIVKIDVNGEVLDNISDTWIKRTKNLDEEDISKYLTDEHVNLTNYQKYHIIQAKKREEKNSGKRKKRQERK